MNLPRFTCSDYPLGEVFEESFQEGGGSTADDSDGKEEHSAHDEDEEGNRPDSVGRDRIEGEALLFGLFLYETFPCKSFRHFIALVDDDRFDIVIIEPFQRRAGLFKIGIQFGWNRGHRLQKQFIAFQELDRRPTHLSSMGNLMKIVVFNESGELPFDRGAEQRAGGRLRIGKSVLNLLFQLGDARSLGG
ncbi:MAG: hypothetical protein BWY50_01225 [Spirochaetes bacterium ADurb.Bin315]|nr:MAG: hypothetical protein BWY50_01225 [Spirochaetes bacterium ADurb.Bin315]